MRIEKSIKNVKYSIIGQIFALIISFIQRTIFIKYLSTELLGINSLFTNILTILSLAELGIGTSITYYLYKPLYENDKEKITKIMNFFKKVYISIGFFIFIAGLLIIPFLRFFITDINSYKNIYWIYILFVANTSISYFFSYNRTLIIADQKKYVDVLYKYGSYVLLNIFQIVFIIFTKNYILFLILQIIFTFLENYFIYKKVLKDYPYIRNSSLKLENIHKKEILKNSKAMLLHKVGWVVVSSTDNLLISKFLNIALVGIYSNYNLIISALNTIIMQIYNAITASIGNLHASEETNTKKQEDIFCKIDFFTFFIFAFSTTCLISLFNSFIELWIGKDFLLNTSTIIIISISFYINGMRKSVLAFRDSMGLFYIDRYKSILEALLNIIFSVILVRFLGINGIFLGTIISSLISSSWIEPYVLYKYGFKMSPKKYFILFIKRVLVLATMICITYYINSRISINIKVIEFTLKLIITISLSIISLSIIFAKDNNLKYFINLFKKKMKGFSKLD